MATLPRIPSRADRGERTSEAEDVAMLLALVIVGVLGCTLLFLVVLEVLEILPGGLDTIAFVSLLVFGAVVGRALIARALATPSIYRGHASGLRHFGR